MAKGISFPLFLFPILTHPFSLKSCFHRLPAPAASWGTAELSGIIPWRNSQHLGWFPFPKHRDQTGLHSRDELSQIPTDLPSWKLEKKLEWPCHGIHAMIPGILGSSQSSLQHFWGLIHPRIWGADPRIHPRIWEQIPGSTPEFGSRSQDPSQNSG